MDQFIPPGYGLVAKTEMPGTGGTAVRAFFHPMERRVIFSISFKSGETGDHQTFMGPVDIRHMNPLLQTIKDLISMPTPFFIRDTPDA